MRIDLILESSAPPETIAELGRLAEGYGLGGIWVSSMLDARDPFMNFAELARTTSSIRMGPIAVSPYELHPLKMATSLLTLNEASRGRAQIVVGGGGGTMTATLQAAASSGPSLRYSYGKGRRWTSVANGPKPCL